MAEMWKYSWGTDQTEEISTFFPNTFLRNFKFKKLVHFFTNEELRLVVRGRFDKEIYFYIKQQKLDCIVKEVTEKIPFGTKKE